MSLRLRLSVLDQSPIPDGGTPADALAATLELARAADELGYHRLWVAEHHQTAAFAGSAPEILAATLLSTTLRLRIGSGGVLLPRYQPVKVAEMFRLLATLHPDRVDLGIGRAGGPAPDFAERLTAVADMVHDPENGYTPPQTWLLGASAPSAHMAADLGLSYAYAHFLRPEPSHEALKAFIYGNVEPASSAVLAVRAIVADTEGKAYDLANAYLLWRSRRDLGHDEPHPSAAQARGHHWTAVELALAERNRQALIAGTAEQVRDEITALARSHDVTEVIVNTLTHDPADRLRSYELLAKAFVLPATR
jgi:alkanesulfonate monooxygenase SsuD/methylene tetrahydromethanopterin reductase-like flavin-dependent oxidoreductase (luciferase family)